jgi:hypothetical protein
VLIASTEQPDTGPNAIEVYRVPGGERPVQDATPS